MKKIFKCLLIIVLFSSFAITSLASFNAFAGSATKVFDTAGVPRGLKIAEGGQLSIFSEYAEDFPVDYYLYQTVAIPVISTTTTIDDEIITVVSSTGVIAGHVITIYEDTKMFQSLVTAATATTISIASPIDFEFTEAALVETGLWSMNVDGSSVTQIFSIKAPPSATIHIQTIGCSMLSATDMDDGKFGGIAALDNGILFRSINGVTKNLAVIVNNIGFWEIGFDVDYSVKAPAGSYGLRARRYIPEVNGIVITLESGSSEFQIHIRDDLTDLDLFACVLSGHKKK